MWCVLNVGRPYQLIPFTKIMIAKLSPVLELTVLGKEGNIVIPPDKPGARRGEGIGNI